MIRAISVSALAVALAHAAAVAAPAPNGAAPTFGTFGFDASGMDPGVAPGDSFFDYANGHWAATTPIPADRASAGAFVILDDLSRERTRGIIEAAAAHPGTDPDAMRIGTYYRTYMDEAGIEAKGLAPIKPALARIDAIATPADLARAFGADERIGIAGPFGVGVEQDPKQPDRYMVGMSQSGLGMPDRDYYLVDNPKFAEARAAYVKHVAAMFRLAGLTDADARAQAVMALETGLAKAQWSRIQNRDPDATYNPRTAAELSAQAPGLDWASFLQAAGVAGQDRFDVSQPPAFAGMAKLVAATPLPVWKDYLTLRTLTARAGVLPKAFVDENFAFYGTVLSGQPQIQPRWKRAVNAVNNSMGEAVGKLYVAQYFPPESKAKIDALVHNLLAAMGRRIDAADWMSPATKAQARAKLATFAPKIGYPSKWRDYSKLAVVDGDAVGNADRAEAFEYDRDLAKLGHPLDRTEWGMTPMEVNAYYNPPMNEVVFPAAILQPPFFDPDADPAINYGAIGAVIGHEISHGFDDEGRKYDATGKLTDWWTPADAKAFEARAAKLVAQYAAYEPLPGIHVKGALTLGENIADLAGLTIAYDAYHMSLGGKPAPVIGGLTGDQRFFLGFAQVWRNKVRDAAKLAQLTSDPHSPAEQRVDEVRNLDPWYAAFGVKPGQKLYLAPDARVHIW